MSNKINTHSLAFGRIVVDRLEHILPVYPVVAEKTTDLPFAVYRRTSLTPKDTKDRFNYEETIGIEIVICAQTYADSIELAQRVKDDLEHYHPDYEGARVNNFTLINCNEDWANDAYIQRLQFTVDIDGETYHRHKKCPVKP